MSGDGAVDLLGDERAALDVNDDAGAPRIVALLSPTCITCLRGAAWLQNELAANPDANVRVYAVWMPMLPSDGRDEWDGRILADPRIAHMWDEGADSGVWFAEAGFGPEPVQWDALFVYGSASRWAEGDQPTDLLLWDRPIIAHTSAFAERLRPLWNGS